MSRSAGISSSKECFFPALLIAFAADLVSFGFYPGSVTMELSARLLRFSAMPMLLISLSLTLLQVIEKVKSFFSFVRDIFAKDKCRKTKMMLEMIENTNK